MKLLYLSEIVGKCGLQTIVHCLPIVKKTFSPDYIIANANSCTGFAGLGRQHAGMLRKYGVHCITLGGNAFLHTDIYEGSPLTYCVRPLNIEQGSLGLGVKLFQSRPQEKANVSLSSSTQVSVTQSPYKKSNAIVVVALLGRFAQHRIISQSPFQVIDTICERYENYAIFVDYSSFSTAEKQALAYYVAGRVSAVIGSGSKVATADETILEGGTAFITDAGRTGSQLSSGGYLFENKIREYRTGLVEYAACSWESPCLQGVFIELDEQNHATKIERIYMRNENTGSSYRNH